ncbi:MAG: ABC transporter substrate-binding protein [Chloroflexi bacterium]|nr:ABC transporter substrate-binding protein [Chloroflexota bacterium]
MALRGGLATYDPRNYGSGRQHETVLANVFDELVVRTPDGKIVPDLATSWKQDDATHFTFNLRPNVKFHDGSPFTADDVKYTLDSQIQNNGIDGKTAARNTLLPPLDPVTVVNPQTVQLAFKGASPPDIILAGLSHIQIVPKALIDKEGSPAFAKQPVGTGAFKFVSGSGDTQTVLARWDGYWGGPPELGTPGPATPNQVVFKVIPEASTTLASLQSGDVQVIQSVPADQVSKLQADSNLQVKTYSGTRTTWIAMNVTKAPFDKVEVRQAMNYGINSQAIMQAIYAGKAQKMTGPVPPFSQYFDSSLQAYPYDQAKAKQLLAQAGYANGFQVVIDCIAAFKDIGDIISQDLRGVGVQATVRVWDDATLRTEALAGNRQMVLWDWGNSFRHPFDLLNPTLLTKGRGNYANYSNPKVDQDLNDGAATSDPTKAAAIYKDAQDTIYQEAPWVFGWVPDEIEAASAKVQNWTPGPDGWEIMQHLSLK